MDNVLLFKFECHCGRVGNSDGTGLPDAWWWLMLDGWIENEKGVLCPDCSAGVADSIDPR
jgi:hypothetical protein